MTDITEFERVLQARLRARASIASRPFDDAAIAREAASGRRDGLRFRSMWSDVRAQRRANLALVAVLLAILALAAAIAVGTRPAELQSTLPPAVIPRAVTVAPATSEQRAAVARLVDGVNSRDVETFVAAFTPTGHFNPRGDFQASSGRFGRHQPVSQEELVLAWLDIVDAWGLEARLGRCDQLLDGTNSYDPSGVEIHCEVRTRWAALSMEVTEVWKLLLKDGRVSWWHYKLLDLEPGDRSLPLGADGLEAWEAWLATNDPAAAVEWLNPHEAPEGGEPWAGWMTVQAVEGNQLAPRLAALESGATKDWQINGFTFAPAGLVRYDPAFAAAIGASIHAYLADLASDQLETVQRVVQAINERDVASFVEAFASDGAFYPGGRIGDSAAVFDRWVFANQQRTVATWMAWLDTWEFEATVLDCRQVPDALGWKSSRGSVGMRCAIGVRWNELATSTTDEWDWSFVGALAVGLDSRHLDQHPRRPDLPLGLDGLAAWKAWAVARDPEATAAWFTVPIETSGPAEGVPLGWDFADNGLAFLPDAPFAFSPRYADEIRASIAAYVEEQS